MQQILILQKTSISSGSRRQLVDKDDEDENDCLCGFEFFVLSAHSHSSLRWHGPSLDGFTFRTCLNVVPFSRMYLVMAAPVISISSDSSDESVGSSIPRVILIGSIPVEGPITPEVGAAAVASPTGVLELDSHSSSEANPSKSSLPPVPVASMVSPFLCSDDSESDTKMPERHLSSTPHDAMLAR
ncbi:hypothetical protein Tco_1509543 [Tanacetum coccineum]